MKLLKTILILLVIVAIFGGAMFALNLYTGPIIEANSAGAANDRLNAVIPDGKAYEDITATLKDLPTGIIAVYKETSGLGYGVVFQAEQTQYSQAPMEITLGVTADGKISGVQIDSYNETADYDFRKKDPNYLASYIGKDSALADIGTVSGSTFSSTAFKNAVTTAMGVLIDNDLVKAGQKSPEQILTELIATVYPAMAPDGVLKTQKIDATGDITVAYRSTNNTGYAYIITKANASYLVIIDTNNEGKAYDVEGKDVTADNGDLIETALAHVEIDKLSVLLAVMPEGSALNTESLLYSADNAAASQLKDVPASVVNVYKEANGLGYIIRSAATSQYTGSTPMDIIIGVGADGKICGIQLAAHSESLIFGDDYPSTYIGKDSALAGVEVYAGSTFSSTAFKTAVEEAMGVLAANNLIAAGEKAPEQILAEMIPTLHTGLTSGGLLKAESVTASGNIVEGYKALNGSGYAFIIKSGDNMLLAIVNAIGNCKVYDTEGADVSASNQSVVDEAVAAANDKKDFTEAAGKMIVAGFADATEITAVDFDTFTNVVYAATFKSAEKTYYAFYSCPLTYGDSAMAVCTVVDENGAIVKQDVKEFLFGHGVEYLPIYGKGYGDVGSGAFKDYENKFGGMTSDKLTDDVLVSGATLSSTAVKLATGDVFNTFNSVKGGEQ